MENNALSECARLGSIYIRQKEQPAADAWMPNRNKKAAATLVTAASSVHAADCYFSACLIDTSCLLHGVAFQRCIYRKVMRDIPVRKAVRDYIAQFETADGVSIISVGLRHAEILLPAAVDGIMHIGPARRFH